MSGPQAAAMHSTSASAAQLFEPAPHVEVDPYQPGARMRIGSHPRSGTLASSPMNAPRPLHGSRLYTDLAPWFPLLSPAEDYAEEISDVHNVFTNALGRLPNTLLELGAGAGHLASHLDRSIRLTLTDLSPDMLDQSRNLNPHAEHIAGDMRTLRLGRRFEAVLIHDAIMYMLTRDDLVAALTTARVHMAEGGACLVLPDCVAETYEPYTETDGEDGEDGRALRYLEWTHPIAPGETVGNVDFVLILKHVDGRTEVVHDRHQWGLFPRETWIEALREAGFSEIAVQSDRWRKEIFLAR